MSNSFLLTNSNNWHCSNNGVEVETASPALFKINKQTKKNHTDLPPLTVHKIADAWVFPSFLATSCADEP